MRSLKSKRAKTMGIQLQQLLPNGLFECFRCRTGELLARKTMAQPYHISTIGTGHQFRVASGLVNLPSDRVACDRTFGPTFGQQHPDPTLPDRVKQQPSTFDIDPSMMQSKMGRAGHWRPRQNELKLRFGGQVQQDEGTFWLIGPESCTMGTHLQG